MSTQNNNTLPNIWLVTEIVHYVSKFSGVTTTVALARTCKVLYNSIIKCVGFWQILYQQHSPWDTDTDIDWLQWQLEQKPEIAEAAADVENRITASLIWFKQYGQRITMGINWQKNKPISTTYIRSPIIDKLLLGNRAETRASYPGWIAITDYDHSSVDLIKLSIKNTVKVHSLNLKKYTSNLIENMEFYRCRQQVADTDANMHLIIHLVYVRTTIEVL
ncbi:hypothetical protein BDF19DRAFT_413310 [Syncephalis fuscata]|nr:hypothetical protein BDF19DRAFT_413310 [Syncephalis fuscata]